MLIILQQLLFRQRICKLNTSNQWFVCTTAATQIKGTAQWLYYIDTEYQQSQQNVAVRSCWVSKVGQLEHGRISVLRHGIYSVYSPPTSSCCAIQFITWLCPGVSGTCMWYSSYLSRSIICQCQQCGQRDLLSELVWQSVPGRRTVKVRQKHKMINGLFAGIQPTLW